VADEELQLDITAKDSASKVVDQVQKKVDTLETSDPVVDISADAKSADHTVDGLTDQLDKLTASDQIVVLALRAGAAQTELRDLATDLATIDASDPDVDVRFARYAEVSGQLDDLETKIKAIGDADPDAGANLEKARTRLDGLGESAGKAGGAVHSMAGNAVGDFAATATGIGPLGEALGQLSETALSGESSLKQLAVAGLGLGALSGAMFLVNQLMATFQKSAAEAAKIKAFNVENAELYADAAERGVSAVDAYVDAAKKAGTVEVAPNADEQARAIDAMGDAADRLRDNQGLIYFTKGIQDVGPALIAAGATAKEFYGSVATGGQSLDDFTAKVLASGASAKEQAAVLAAVQYQLDQYRTGAQNAADDAKLFGTELGDTTAAADDYVRQLADVAASHRNQVTDTRRVITALRDAKKATNDLDQAYQQLQGTIDHDQSMINLQNQIANVDQAAQDAWAAQVEANAALAAGAKDAGEKQAAADQAARDYQTSINSLKSDIVSLGETAGATPVEVDSTLDKIDQGDYNAVTSDAEAYFRRNPIDAATRLKLINNLVAGVGQAVTVSQSSSAPAINVTQVLPRGYHGDALGEATAAARRSGGLYRRSRR
jgi:hypothetical protein